MIANINIIANPFLPSFTLGDRSCASGFQILVLDLFDKNRLPIACNITFGAKNVFYTT
jgi:hypothetical protein